MNLQNRIAKSENKMFKRAIIKTYGRDAYEKFLVKLENVKADEMSKRTFYEGVALHKYNSDRNKDLDLKKPLIYEVMDNSKYPSVKYEKAMHDRIFKEMANIITVIWMNYEKIYKQEMNLGKFYRMIDLAHLAFLSGESHEVLNNYYENNLSYNDGFNDKYYPNFTKLPTEE